MKFRRGIAALAMIGATFSSTYTHASERLLNDVLNSPEWFSITGESRIRFEHLDEQYRAGLEGSDQGLYLRTNLLAEAKFDNFSLVGELLDSRQLFDIADEGSPLSTSTVNPLDVLQAYVEVPTDNFLPGKGSVKVGRFTMNIGSRRFVSRNGTRNTINSYAGIDWQWKDSSNNTWRAFYTSPVQRRVDGDPLDNEAKTDQIQEEVDFWGLYFSPNSGRLNSEWYVFGLDEDDDVNQPTANRELYTVGGRIWKKPAPNQWDYQIESAYQWGDSNASRSSDVELDNSAYFIHTEIGYSFDHPKSPQLIFQYDYVSGDKDADDNDTESFDTLFGSRRFDFGPTATFGPFVRNNLSTPGVRFKWKPSDNTRAHILLRGFWLASDEDGLRAAGISNAEGESENYIGTQLAVRWRWNAIPNRLKFDVSAAYLDAGDLLENAGQNDATFVYTAATFVF
ncbi:alginate export family protein [Sessilibacter corallicola]|uniref:alginate export family protein n=1 Tax=Sessilibacter corallicola TaxID=2904075 RepID=UPI001E554334|nr:alginate export family protein [Sessilibacter corallicola]MCE2027011.1 alginate export family protein [Sessilibacter corallicola]